jgi:hypothetical protein
MLASKATPQFGFAALAISLLILSPIAFHSKSPLVFYRFDGIYLLIAAVMQKTWSVSDWYFTSNPLQGIGGLELPQHNLMDPALWLTAHLPASIGPTVAMTFYAVLLAAIICWLATRLGMAPLPTILAAWLGPLLALPYVYPSLGFDFLWGDPTYIMLIAFNTAAILLYLDLGRGPLVADVGRFFAIAAACAYGFLQFPNFVPVSLVVLAFFGVVALLMAASRRERLLKLAAAIVLGAAAAAIFAGLIFGLYGFAKPTFFWYEFFPRPGSLRDLSFFIAEHSRWPSWIVYAVSLAGALHAALRGGATMRPMARGFLAFVGAELMVAFLVEQGWKGPRIAYIDILTYPFYCVFAAHGAAAAIGWVDRRIGRVIGHDRVGYNRAGIAVLCLLPWLVLIDYWPPPLERPFVRNLNPYIWPPAETPVSKFLAREIALRPGQPFRGRIASVAGSDFEPEWISAPLITQHNYDVVNLFLSGNDHRLYGLWYYGIPTLIELNQFSSPFFHLVNARLLNAPGSKDLRSYETQSIVNDRIMALLGVRYLLSNKLLPDRTPVLHHRLVEGQDLYIYSVPDPNLAGYSVTQIHRAADARDAINLLADPSLDPRKVAVLTEALEVPTLVPARRSVLVVERGGYRIEADSTGTSLLVLPLEYSHCLRADLTASGATPPRLLRANLAMAAILFSGQVKGTLKLRYGPFSSSCRIEDWREAEVLRIGEARDWPSVPQENKIVLPLEQIQATRISQLEQLLTEKDALLGQQGLRITQLEQLLAKKDASFEQRVLRMSELERLLAEKDASFEQRVLRINQLERLLAEKDASLEQQALRVSELERILEATYNSRSWKLTAPLRRIMNWLRH